MNIERDWASFVNARTRVLILHYIPPVKQADVSDRFAAIQAKRYSLQLQLREYSLSQGGQGQSEYFGGGSLGEGQYKVLLDGLREVEIDGQVRDLALQLLKALLEVEVLVCLGKDDLR